ncbi:MAG: hypothetical protein GTO45_31915 [Candidatus Aminicenantes bacterium]|nr:hypothetical protein [Candidatus Aminicenantes bacterium]NIM77927.1 hypothetical protein [Candidatus Aminicenantes bacterium]NIN22744.1 hypothetical protein [Candidatus Aminicenantes bacterium]NIN45910.1 hypothetical protein [Candidatus Aminicenantes bacterium]NIN89386.1 hypothetical protein [Candidatus Aminicenantes bacterium]
MAETRRENEKNPVGAAVLSAIVPGVGFFYIGNFLKGIAYMLIFASIIVMIAEGRGHEAPILGLMLAGFYIFQIFDSFNEAKKTRYREVPKEVTTDKEKDEVSLFAAVTILVVGIVFQLAELDVIRYRDIARLWPLILIGFGVKFIFTYVISSRAEKGDENQYDSLENEK